MKASLHFKKIVKPVSVLFLLFVLTGCVAIWPFVGSGEKKVKDQKPENPPEAKCAEDVPFIAAKEDMTAFSALSMVFKYYGKEIPPEEIAKAIIKDKKEKVNISDLALYARRNGFIADISCGTFEAIRDSILYAAPVIVPIKDTFMSILGKDKFLVIYGYNDPKKFFLAHSDKPSIKISYSKFKKEWREKDSLMLTLTPK